ncbi:MAG TPA: nitrilase-related carbon-nitrogen hydrolase, partial [Microlunatus sp.]|nr:nitrilase-related carbon-nitrogen hydrolase [Microlunatus sp.]
MRVAVCQLNSRTDRAANVKVARELLARAADAGADLAVLPEYTDYLGPGDQAPPPEPVDGPYATGFAEAARE